MHLPNVPQYFGKTFLLLLGFSASTFIRPAFTEPLPETPNLQTYSDFTEFPEVDIVVEDSESTLPVL